MLLRNKKTGEIGELYYEPDKEYHFTVATEDPADMTIYRSISELSADWEDYKPKEPLIKDEKIRKAVRAWAEANNFSVFRVHNQHFNYVKIHGVKDRYDPNGSNIEFMGTIAGAEKRTYEIDELCGEEEE